MKHQATLPYRISKQEEGTTLVLMAMMLVVLMGFAAIAVDGAAAWALKRQDQSAADTAAIAGAMFAANHAGDDAMQAAEDEVIRITYSTIGPDMTPDEWADEWTTCLDADKPAEYTETLGSDCISFTANMSQIRVRTPIIPWETTFARVIGFDRIDTDAVAEVTISLASSGGVLPFGMPGDTASKAEVCLKTGANPKNVSPCDGPDQGNFGFLDFSQYGNAKLGTSTVCNGGGTTAVERNIATGIDHSLGTTNDPFATPHTDRTGCSEGNINYRPYHVATEPGNMAQVLHDGFVDGTAGVDGKLAQGTNLVNVRGNLLDNTPLWDYLNSAGGALCGSISTHTELVACLDDPANRSGDGTWTAGQIFSADVADAPRFGWVPLLLEPTLGTGQTTVTITGFIPVYIQTTFWGCKAKGCDLEWDPGEPFSPGPSNIRVEASTALNIPAGALPQEIRDAGPGGGGEVTYLLTR